MSTSGDRGGDGAKEFKPEVQSGSTHITIKVQDMDDRVVFYRIERTTPLKTLMHDYCQKLSLDKNYFTFLFDGCKIREEQTPANLLMEDGDMIDAMDPMMGGGGWISIP